MKVILEPLLRRQQPLACNYPNGPGFDSQSLFQSRSNTSVPASPLSWNNFRAATVVTSPSLYNAANGIDHCRDINPSGIQVASRKTRLAADWRARLHASECKETTVVDGRRRTCSRRFEIRRQTTCRLVPGLPLSRPIIYKHGAHVTGRVQCKQPIVNRTETAKHSAYTADSQLFQGAPFSVTKLTI
jgi:hypothetical protein